METGVVELFLAVVLGAIVAWWSRRRLERGTVARAFATGIAALLSFLGLAAVGLYVFLFIAFASWANSK
jgi:predicted PurR-regulated permease PerM